MPNRTNLLPTTIHSPNYRGHKSHQKVDIYGRIAQKILSCGKKLKSPKNNKKFTLKLILCICTLTLFIVFCTLMISLKNNHHSINDNVKTKAGSSLNLPAVSNLDYEADIIRATIWEKIETYQEPETCQKTEYFVCELHQSCGFGCVINSVLQCMAHSHRELKTMVFKNENTVFGPSGAWNKWLLPISKCQPYYNKFKNKIESLKTTTNFKNSDDKWEEHREWVPKYTESFINSYHMNYPTGWFLGILNGYIFREFQPNVEEYINNKMNKMFDITNYNDININVATHIRRTDKVSWGEALKFNVREYVNEIDHFTIMSNNNRHYHGSYKKKYNINVYLATDEPEVIHQIETKYNQYRWYYNKIGATRSNEQDLSGRLMDDEGTMNLLYDIIIMSKADYFVGTLSSNVGRLIFQLFANKYVDPSKYIYSLDEEYYGPV